MSLPDRNNPYNFDEFLEWRNNVDYYADDPFIQKVVRHFARDEWELVDREARAVSRKPLTGGGTWLMPLPGRKSGPISCITMGTDTALTVLSGLKKRR